MGSFIRPRQTTPWAGREPFLRSCVAVPGIITFKGLCNRVLSWGPGGKGQESARFGSGNSIWGGLHFGSPEDFPDVVRQLRQLSKRLTNRRIGAPLLKGFQHFL